MNTFLDEWYWYRDYSQDPFNAYNNPNSFNSYSGIVDQQGTYVEEEDSLYFLPTTVDATRQWTENKIFGGTDRIFGSSNHFIQIRSIFFIYNFNHFSERNSILFSI